jgi:hypothetical protein
MCRSSATADLIGESRYSALDQIILPICSRKRISEHHLAIDGANVSVHFAISRALNHVCLVKPRVHHAARWLTSSARCRRPKQRNGGPIIKAAGIKAQ